MFQQQITSTYKAMAPAPNMAVQWRQCIRSIVFAIDGKSYELFKLVSFWKYSLIWFIWPRQD